MKINILNKAIYVVDYEQEQIREIVSEGEFDEYIRGLISNINENETTRLYKIRRDTTEVVNCTNNIMSLIHNGNIEEEKMDKFNEYSRNIANKLLNEEIKTQEQISKMGTSVKKGSLIEVLLYNTEINTYSFLLAKVEHKSFFDDINFKRRTGYSTEDNKLWKSCLFNFGSIDEEISIEEIKVFLDNSAKYWTENFLEIDPMNNDDRNTQNAFRSIDIALTRNIKKQYPKDYTILRNSVICYFKSKEIFNFDDMYDMIFKSYLPSDMENDVYTANVIDKMNKLKESQNFDNQFRINKKIIKAKVRKVYEVNNNIELKIIDGIDNLNEIINSYEDPTTGDKYIRIKTNNDETYNSFK